MNVSIPTTFGDIILTPSEFGDPYSVTVTFPKKAKGKLILPRSMFSKQLREHMREAFEHAQVP